MASRSDDHLAPATAEGDTGSGPRRLLRRDERQAQLLRAAATAFARGGFAATSMEDVAAAAGVTKLIVYRHFSSKEELYRAVVTKVAVRLRDDFEVERADAHRQRRKASGSRVMLRVARDNPDGFRLLTRHAMREPEFAGIARAFLEGASAITDATIGDTIPDAVVKAWAGPVIVDYLVQGVLTWLDCGDPERDDEFVDLANRGLLGMFLAWADPERVPPRLRRVLEGWVGTRP